MSKDTCEDDRECTNCFNWRNSYYKSKAAQIICRPSISTLFAWFVANHVMFVTDNLNIAVAPLS